LKSQTGAVSAKIHLELINLLYLYIGQPVFTVKQFEYDCRYPVY